jgi:hypothetical protein
MLCARHFDYRSTSQLRRRPVSILRSISTTSHLQLYCMQLDVANTCGNAADSAQGACLRLLSENAELSNQGVYTHVFCRV